MTAKIDYLMDLLGDQLAEIEAGWSVGTFGAIAEFTRDADIKTAMVPESAAREAARLLALRQGWGDTPPSSTWATA